MKIAAINFWKGFSLETGLIRLLIDMAVGPFEVVKKLAEADLVLSSTFGPMTNTIPFREKTIGIIWENLRPDYRGYAFSFSSDFDSYAGRNCRLPYWFNEIAWPGLKSINPANYNDNGFQAPVTIESLMRSRKSMPDRQGFCCFVANNPELHRKFAIEALSTIGQVGVFGGVVGRPLKGSKYDLLPNYRFNLCFENSTFPGYYTEKALHAWVSGCVPLYYADRWVGRDFNPQALVNRMDFSTLSDFARHVASLDKDPFARAALTSAPLIIQKPSLDRAAEFLRRVAHTRAS